MSVPHATDGPTPLPAAPLAGEARDGGQARPGVNPPAPEQSLTSSQQATIESGPIEPGPIEPGPIEPGPAMQTPQELLDAMPASLAYTRCATVAEYLSAHAPPGSPLALRMSEARLTSDAQSVMVGCSDPLNLLALVAPNLPDAPGVIPLWVRMAQCCPRAELRFAGEADAFLVERLLGEEAASILDAIELPWLLVFNEEWQLVAQWGPRPQSAEAMIDEWLAQHPDFEALAEAAADGADSAQEGAPAEASPTSDAAGEQLAALLRNLMLHTRLWYNSGLDADCSAELQQLLAGLHDESESPEDVQDGT